jgi:putative acetyltransferase
LIEVREGGLDLPEVQALLRLHLESLRTISPSESVHALDLSGLRRPEISFFTAWEDGHLLGCGALKQLDPAHGEIKSMRTDPERLRRGTGAALLSHILGVARGRGYKRISLETGSGPAFEASLALYRQFGFTPSEAFADYPADDPFSRFLSRVI